MSKQPEALRLANEIERVHFADKDFAAAAELRRQHALIAEFTSVLKHAMEDCIWPSPSAGSDVYTEAMEVLSKAKSVL